MVTNQIFSTQKFNVDTLHKFLWLLEEAKFYNAASTFLADSFVFTSDDLTSKSKQGWLAQCPDKHDTAPDFGEVMNGDANQLIRTATPRKTNRRAFQHCCVVKQVVEFDSLGKIKGISIQQQQQLELKKASTTGRSRLHVLRLVLSSATTISRKRTTSVASLSTLSDTSGVPSHTVGPLAC